MNCCSLLFDTDTDTDTDTDPDPDVLTGSRGIGEYLRMKSQ